MLIILFVDCWTECLALMIDFKLSLTLEIILSFELNLSLNFYV